MKIELQYEKEDSIWARPFWWFSFEAGRFKYETLAEGFWQGLWWLLRGLWRTRTPKSPAPACKTCDYLDFYGNHPTDCPDCNAGEGEK